MAITFKFTNTDYDFSTPLHEALKGSQAYIDSEIALVQDNGFTKLIVGNDNENDIEIEVNSSNVIMNNEK